MRPSLFSQTSGKKGVTSSTHQKKCATSPQDTTPHRSPYSLRPRVSKKQQVNSSKTLQNQKNSTKNTFVSSANTTRSSSEIASGSPHDISSATQEWVPAAAPPPLPQHLSCAQVAWKAPQRNQQDSISLNSMAQVSRGGGRPRRNRHHLCTALLLHTLPQKEQQATRVDP